MISKLAKRLYETYYTSGQKPFLLNIDLDNIQIQDIKKKATRSDGTLLNGISKKKWKLLNKKRMLFKIYDSGHNYNLQVRLNSSTRHDDLHNENNKTKLAKYVFSGISGIKNINTTELPLMNIDFDKLPSSFIKKVNSYNLELDPSKKYSIEITEHFFKMKTLEDYLKDNNSLSEIKNVLFYILFTLHCYRHLYPKFEHNSLTSKNIYVYCIETEEGSYKEINVDGVIYLVPNNGCEIKLSCFEKCQIEGTTSIFKDIQTLIKSFEHFDNPRLKEFLEKMKIATSYREILYDSFFDEFKKPDTIKSGGSEVSISSSSVEDVDENERILSDLSLSSTTLITSESFERGKAKESNDDKGLPDDENDDDSSSSDSEISSSEDTSSSEETGSLDEHLQNDSGVSSSVDNPSGENDDDSSSSDSEISSSEDTSSSEETGSLDENLPSDSGVNSSTENPSGENDDDSSSSSEEQPQMNGTRYISSPYRTRLHRGGNSKDSLSPSLSSSSSSSSLDSSTLSSSSSEDWLDITETEKPQNNQRQQGPFNRFSSILGGDTIFQSRLPDYKTQQFGFENHPQRFMPPTSLNDNLSYKTSVPENFNIGYNNMQNGGSKNIQDDFFF